MKKYIEAIVLLISIIALGGCGKSDGGSASDMQITTFEASGVSDTAAISGGSISLIDTSVAVTARGVCWSTSQNPTLTDSHTDNGTGEGLFVSNITGLQATTTYYVRAYAVTKSKTLYGYTQTFTTLEAGVVKPHVTTAGITIITDSSAVSGGTVSVRDSSISITARGICWSTGQTPVITDNHTTNGSGTGSFASGMTDLQATTTYYVRAYAVTKTDTIYGSVISYTTLKKTISYGTLTDVSGNTYKTVKIGTQTWMSENLRTAKYKDGTTIPIVTNDTAWSKLTTGAQCTYNNTSDIDAIQMYGRLYNWYAVQSGTICPSGWHVPTHAEWTVLENYLIANGYNYDRTTSGNKIGKSLAGTSEWNLSNGTGDVGTAQSANNSTGFTALPEGFRYSAGGFYNLGTYGYWWTSTEYGTGSAYCRYLYYSYASLLSNTNSEKDGFAVRCVKDK